eukprot:5433897-Pyramimonas_sp.AAC.1
MAASLAGGRAAFKSTTDGEVTPAALESHGDAEGGEPLPAAGGEAMRVPKKLRGPAGPPREEGAGRGPVGLEYWDSAPGAALTDHLGGARP